MHNLSDEHLSVIEKVKKLLALADNNDNEHQAEAAAAKAMDLLAAYNLDMAMVSSAKGKGDREKKIFKGGLYQWQRNLWNSVARLNFCMYLYKTGTGYGQKYEHRLIGRVENVIGASTMADYLQSTIDRLAKEWAKERGLNVFCRDAIAYREGMAVCVVGRLEEKRRKELAEEERKREEQKARAKHPAYADSGTALVLSDVIQNETDLNNDYQNGWEPGTTASRRAEREALQAAAQAAYQEELRKQEEWDAAHPEEAAARKKREREEADRFTREWEKREARNAKRRKGYTSVTKMDSASQRTMSSAYNMGYKKGDDIGLDKQVAETTKKRIT